MSADRWYGKGGQGMSKTEMQLKVGKCKPKRRLKADIVKSINKLVGFQLESVGNMTVKGLTQLEEYLEAIYRITR